jgi:hypothetical protein
MHGVLRGPRPGPPSRVWSTSDPRLQACNSSCTDLQSRVYITELWQPGTIAQHEGNRAADGERVRGRRAATVGLDPPAATVGRLIGAAARQPTSGWTQAVRWSLACYLGSSTEFQWIRPLNRHFSASGGS